MHPDTPAAFAALRRTGWTYPRIGRAFGRTGGSVFKVLKRSGLWTPVPHPDRTEALELYAAGLTAAEVGRRLGKSQVTISAWVREAGLSRPRRVKTEREPRVPKPPRVSPAPKLPRPPRRPKIRRHSWPSSDHSFVRTRKGGIQARVFLDGRMWNLGLHKISLYVSHDAACRRASLVSREFMKRLAVSPRPHPVDVFLEMKTAVVDGRPLIPPHCWPLWTFQLPDLTFGARNGRGRNAVVLTGYPTPKAAYTAAAATFTRRRRRTHGRALAGGGDGENPGAVPAGIPAGPGGHRAGDPDGGVRGGPAVA